MTRSLGHARLPSMTPRRSPRRRVPARQLPRGGRLALPKRQRRTCRMTRSPKTAVLTSSTEAEYAATSLSSSSAGGERERDITYREKTCIQFPSSGLSPAATVRPSTFPCISQKLHFAILRALPETATHFTVKRKAHWPCIRTMRPAQLQSCTTAMSQDTCSATHSRCKGALPETQPLLWAQQEQTVQKPVLPVQPGHNWGAL